MELHKLFRKQNFIQLISSLSFLIYSLRKCWITVALYKVTGQWSQTNEPIRNEQAPEYWPTGWTWLNQHQNQWGENSLPSVKINGGENGLPWTWLFSDLEPALNNRDVFQS